MIVAMTAALIMTRTMMEKVGTKARFAKGESKLATNHKRPSHGEASLREHSCRNDLHFWRATAWDQ